MKQTISHPISRVTPLLVFFLLTFSIDATASEDRRFKDIYAYALFADAAYQTQDVLKQKLASSDYAITAHDELPGYGVSYYVVTDDKKRRQIIVVRGTSNIENAAVDVAFNLIDDAHTGIKLHQGFARSASYIYERLKPELHRDYQIDTTGHSLGGAVALILAMHLDSDKFNVGRVVTFGQPKVSNVSGSKHYAHLDVTRVVTQKDMVPLLPPLDPMSMMDLNIYWHQGTEVVLLDDDQYALLEGMDSIMRATDAMVEIPSEKNLQHHMMSTYISGIRARLDKAQLVEYQSRSIFELLGH